MEKKKILLATGNENLDQLLLPYLQKQFEVLDETVDYYRHLLVKINNYQPNIVIIHDRLIFLEGRSQQENNKQWQELLEELRETFPKVRVVFIANRKEEDPFISVLINLGIYDLFLGDSIKANLLVNQLLEEPLFSNVSRLKRIHSEKKLLEADVLEEKDSVDEETEQNSLFSKLKQSLPFQSSDVVKKIVKVPEFMQLPSKLIVIGSLYPECGSSFLSCNLAACLNYLKIPVGVLEYPANKPYLFDLLYGEVNAPDNWTSWYGDLMKKGKIKAENSWKDGQIVWLPLDPKLENKVDREAVFHLFSVANHIPYLIVDISNNWEDDELRPIWDAADEVWIVVKPNPIKIRQYLSYLETLREVTGRRLNVIGNMWPNRAKKKKFLKEWLDVFYHIEEKQEHPKDYKDAFIAHVPLFNPDIIHQSEWEGKVAQQYREIRDEILESFYPLIQKIVPKNLQKDIRLKKHSILQRFRGVF